MRDQIKKFLFVGGINFLVEFSMFNLLYILLNADYKMAATLSFVLMLIGSYFLNKYWTFRKIEKSLKEVIYYFIMYFLLLNLKIFTIKILIYDLEFHAITANTLSMIITSSLAFVTLKYFIFGLVMY